MDEILRFSRRFRQSVYEERFTMKRRWIAMLLLLSLVCSALPVQTSAANAEEQITEEQRIKDQVEIVYRSSLFREEKKTFLGFCGRAVNNQLYYMGIDTMVRGINGKDEFDRYKKLGETPAGYPCRAYAASEYTLLEALNLITAKGAKNVYNILVGFETTTSEDGQNFGHAVVVYAILNGIVYFTECCDVMVDEKFWPEGSAIYCSIEAFSKHYETWTTYDGLIWFGDQSYYETCKSFDADLDVMSLSTQAILSNVPIPALVAQPQQVGMVQAGEILAVEGIRKTPEGVYWYEVKQNDVSGYVAAAACKALKSTQRQMSIEMTDVLIPSNLWRGQAFVLSGHVHAPNGRLRKLEVAVYKKSEADMSAPIYYVQTEVDSKNVSLRELTEDVILWDKLPVGEYRLTIRARTESRYIEKGSVYKQFQEQQVWSSEFSVTYRSKQPPNISFDACGGETTLNMAITDKGEALAGLPVATREGHVFLGWYTKPKGGEPITLDTTFSKDTTVYAQWKPGDPDYTGWLQTNGKWTYYREGLPASGWFYFNGLRFYQDDLGKVPNGWRKIDDQWYYFSGIGAVNTGWVETSRGISYLRADGRPAVGEITISGKSWLFDKDGTLVLR